MTSMTRTILCSILALAACGESSQEAPPPAAPPPPAQHEDTSPKLAVTQELGSIDPGEVQKVWDRLESTFLACKKSGMERVQYLHGDLKFFLRVGTDGHVKWAYFEDSTLGDRDTERCVLDAVTQAQWPKPIGGDAEIRNSLGFDPEGRPPTPWSQDKIEKLLDKNGKDLAKCKHGIKGQFHITMYVEPHNKKEGKVQAVGASIPNKDAGEKIDCIVEEIKSWKVPSPGSWGAKVDFRF